GVEPISLLLGHDDVLYGVAYEGGCTHGGDCGTLFRVNLDGSAFRVLRRFSATNEGAYGSWALADGKDGYLYGATLDGGVLGGGTLYKISTDGSEFNVLRDFSTTNGLLKDLTLGSDDRLYGVLG